MSNLMAQVLWTTAFKNAHKKLSLTDKKHVVYCIDGKYKCALLSTWNVMKPGTIVCIVQNQDRMFDGYFTRRRNERGID